MLIQCQSCNSKYRLALERIPNRKTFIKCKKCNAPIYIDAVDAQEESEAQPAIIPPEAAAGIVQPPVNGSATVVVTCDQCRAGYRVAAASLGRAGLKLRCSNCGHQFPVPEKFLPAAGEGAPPLEGPGGSGQEFFPSAASESGQPAPDVAEQEMPLPDDARISGMFDDLQVGGEPGEPSGLPEPGPWMSGQGGGDPEKAYLDAVSLDGGAATGALPEKGTVSDAQKYRFFLKPKDGEGDGPEESPPGEPEAAEAAKASVAETPGGGSVESAGESAGESAPEEEELPVLETEFPDAPQPAESTSLPALRDEEIQTHGPNDPIPEQVVHAETENRRFLALSAGLAAVLVGALAWGFLSWSMPEASEPFTVMAGTPAELSVTTTREAYFVDNKPSGERLYVVTGEVASKFPSSEQVGWMRLRGSAIGKDGKPRKEGHSYAGNLLNDDQLANWKLRAIFAYYGYVNGRNDSNFRIEQGAAVPFQIVLRGVKEPPERNSTAVVSFMRAGRPVYLEQFR